MSKLRSLLKNKWLLGLVFVALAAVLYSKMFNQFFYADDWFHLQIVQINSVEEFASFFSFSESGQQASFYRPLPTQFFFGCATNCLA